MKPAGIDGFNGPNGITKSDTMNPSSDDPSMVIENDSPISSNPN